MAYNIVTLQRILSSPHLTLFPGVPKSLVPRAPKLIPPPPPRRRRAIIILRLMCRTNPPLPLPLPARTTARKEDNHHAQKQHDKPRDQRPEPAPEIRHRALAIVVDIILQYPKRHRVRRQHHQRQHPRQKRHYHADQTPEHPGTQRDQERDKREPACDGVQHHYVGKAVGRVGGCFAESGAFGLGHFVRGPVPDCAGSAHVGAVVLGVEHAVAECAEGDGGGVAQFDVEDAKRVDDGRGDGGYQQADGGGEEEEGAEPGVRG